MMTQQKISYIDYCKNYITEHIYDFEGTNHYMCDLAYDITADINMDGTATFSRCEAIDYIREWWYDAADVYQYQMDNYGKCLHNPFEDPEAFHVCMIIEGVNMILTRCNTVNKNWNNEICLTTDVIKQILSEVDAVETIEW